MDATTQILQAPYSELPISNALKRFFNVHQIPTLEKLLEFRTKELLEMKWFNERMLRELIHLLEEHQLLKKLV